MDLFLYVLVGILAATGAICILKEVYAIIMINCLNGENHIVMTIKGDGLKSEMMLRTALLIRQRYFPKMEIVFIEQVQNIYEPTPAKYMAQQYQMLYIDRKE